MNISRLKTIVTWLLLSNMLAAIVGVVTMLTGTREAVIAAMSSVGLPQPTPAETVVLFVPTVASFYIFAELVKRDRARQEAQH